MFIVTKLTTRVKYFVQTHHKSFIGGINDMRGTNTIVSMYK